MESSRSAGKFTSKLMQANKKVPRSDTKKPLEGLHTLMHVLFALCHALFPPRSRCRSLKLICLEVNATLLQSKTLACLWATHHSISDDYRWALEDELGFITVTQTFDLGCKFWHPAISVIIISAKDLLSFFSSILPLLFQNWVLGTGNGEKNSVHNQWHSLSNDLP